MNLRTMFICLLAVCTIQGCAFISIPLSQRTQPLEEKVLEGEGRDKILLIDISGVISSEKKRSFADLECRTRYGSPRQGGADTGCRG